MSASASSMNVISTYATKISEYLPETLKDAAGLSRQISEDVKHITWLSVERVLWPQEVVHLFLVIGYSDGLQVWDLQDPTTLREVLSKQDKSVLLVRMLPTPLASSNTLEGPEPLGIASAPMIAHVHRGAPSLIRLFSMRAHDDVHLLRLTEPARLIQASRRFFAVGLARQVDLYDALDFHHLFNVPRHASSCLYPTFALGHRWLAYNLPPQQPAAAFNMGTVLTGGVGRVPSMVREGLQYLGQVGQRTLDHVLMPPTHDGGADQGPQGATQPAQHCGVVAVRDAASRALIAQFADHAEPIELMAWDPSGLQLVTCAALGHRVLVHRALLGAEHTLLMHDDSVEGGGLALGGVVFQHLYTLSRGYTPAVISDITVSDDGQQVAVSSAKGTTHVFRLPPLHSAALGHHLTETGAVRLAPAVVPRAGAPLGAAGALLPPELGIGFNFDGGPMAPPKPVNLCAATRVKLGSLLLQEGLTPQCGFLSASQASGGAPAAASAAAVGRSSSSTTGGGASSMAARSGACPRMYVATRAGTLALYSLVPGSPREGNAHAGAGHVGGSAAAAAAPGGGGSEGCAADTGELRAVLTKEVRVCRPFKHFVECRPSPHDLGICAPLSPAHTVAPSSPKLPSPRDTPPLCPSSPMSGTRAASPKPVSGASNPVLGRSTAEDASSAGVNGNATPAMEFSKWSSQIETATHVPMEVALWLSPQLSFYSYPASVRSCELNRALRAGEAVPDCKRIAVSRPERLGDRIHYFGAPAPSEERLSELFGGALGAAVDDAPQPTAPVATSRRRELAVAPAWGSIGDPHALASGACGGSLEQADGIGPGLAEDLEEDWLRA